MLQTLESFPGVRELMGVLCSILVTSGSDQWSGNTDHLIRDSNCVANHDDAALVATVPLQVVALTDCCRRHCMAQLVPGCLMKTATDFAAGVAG